MANRNNLIGYPCQAAPTSIAPKGDLGRRESVSSYSAPRIHSAAFSAWMRVLS